MAIIKPGLTKKFLFELSMVNPAQGGPVILRARPKSPASIL